MFLEFFQLQQQPFGVTPNPAYLFPSQTHRDALYELSSGIQDDRGFLTLIAQPGMGKTTVLYQLLNELRDLARTAFIFQTQCDSRDFFGYLLSELGIQPDGMSLVSMHNRLNQVLFEEMLAGKRFVLVVDEAQNLDDSVLETIRLLSNFERENTKLLQIVLAGQPQLAEKLGQRQLAQLRQRIAVMCQLRPFNASETACYIEHRLTVAGYSGDPIFAQEALKLIAQLSGGVPRSINNICYSSLSAAHRRGQLTVNEGLIREVAVRLGLAVSLPPITLSIAASPKEMDSSDSAQPVLTILEKIVSSLNGEAHDTEPHLSDTFSKDAGAIPFEAEARQAPALADAKVPDPAPDFAWELAVPAEQVAGPAAAAPPKMRESIPEVVAADDIDKTAEIVSRVAPEPTAPPAPVPAAAPAEDRDPVERTEDQPAFAMYQEVFLELHPEPEVAQAPPPAAPATAPAPGEAVAAPPSVEEFEKAFTAVVNDAAAAPAAPAETHIKIDSESAPSSAQQFEKVFTDAVKDPVVAAAAPAETCVKADSETAPSPVEKYMKVFADAAETSSAAIAVPAGLSKFNDASSTVLSAEPLPEPQPAVSELKEPAAPEHEPVETDVFEAMSLASPKVISEIAPAAAVFPPTVDEVLTPIVFETGGSQPYVPAEQEKAPPALAMAAAANSQAKKPAIHPAAATAAAAWRSEMVRRQNSQPLTYKSHSKSLLRRWLFPTIGLAIVLLGGSYYFFPSILKLARSWQETASASSESSAPSAFSPSDASTDSTAAAPKPENSESAGSTVAYPADPQETGENQVVTVAVEPNETLQMICLLYVGHFDAQLLEQIRSLNPEMKDPEHLGAGQLIRIPLPLKTLKKVADSADSAPPASTPTPEKRPSLLTKFWGLLQSKK